MSTHLTWSEEAGGEHCGERPVFVILSGHANVDEGDQERAGQDTIDTGAEVTGHFCLKCDRLVSLSLNQ